MKMIFLISLALVWAAFIVPPLLRRSREGRPGSSVVSFRQQLSALERATPGQTLASMPASSADLAPLRGASSPMSLAPMTRSEVVRRRRDVLLGLAAATGFTFLLVAIAGGTLATLLFLASAGSLGAYVYALVQIRKRAEEQAVKVRILHPQAPRTVQHAPVVALRRSV